MEIQWEDQAGNKYEVALENTNVVLAVYPKPDTFDETYTFEADIYRSVKRSWFPGISDPIAEGGDGIKIEYDSDGKWVGEWTAQDHGRLNPDYYFVIPDYHEEKSESLTVISKREDDAEFFTLTPSEFIKGESIPVILGYRDWTCGYNPNLNYATVKIGAEGNQRIVDLYSNDGKSLNIDDQGGRSIDFTDPDSWLNKEYYKITKDEDWWYTVGYIRPEDYLEENKAYWENQNENTSTATLAIEATYHWREWFKGHMLGENRQTLVSDEVMLITSRPGWENWYAGDTHFHSALTDLDFSIPHLVSPQWIDVGTPLSIARLLGESKGLEWTAVTDHSYSLEDTWEPFSLSAKHIEQFLDWLTHKHENIPNEFFEYVEYFQHVILPEFVSGMIPSVNVDDINGISDWLTDLHNLLISDDVSNDLRGLYLNAGIPLEPLPFDNPDVYMPLDDYRADPKTYQWEKLEENPAFTKGDMQFLKGIEISVGTDFSIDNPSVFPQLHLLAYGFDENDDFVRGPGAIEMRELEDVLEDMESMNGVFGYAAHPMLNDWLFAEPWTVEDATKAFEYKGHDGTSIFRGFQFWNKRADEDRDASLELWEDILAEHPDNRDWYLAGGSDDHLSARLAGETSMGDVRTVVAAPSNSQDDILEAFYHGRSFVTDGPYFTMGIDQNGSGSLTDFDGNGQPIDTMPGGEAVVNEKKDAQLQIAWPDQSDTPWGEIDLFKHVNLVHYDLHNYDPEKGIESIKNEYNPNDDEHLFYDPVGHEFFENITFDSDDTHWVFNA